jgi:hypothetical protein
LGKIFLGWNLNFRAHFLLFGSIFVISGIIFCCLIEIFENFQLFSSKFLIKFWTFSKNLCVIRSNFEHFRKIFVFCDKMLNIFEKFLWFSIKFWTFRSKFNFCNKNLEFSVTYLYQFLTIVITYWCTKMHILFLRFKNPPLLFVKISITLVFVKKYPSLFYKTANPRHFSRNFTKFFQINQT